MMNDEEKKVLDELPDVVKIYRGVNLKEGDELDTDDYSYDMGISWTIDKERGEWFGNRFKGNDCYLLEGEVDKSDIFCYFNSRKENEVVIRPFDIRNLKVTKM